MDPERRVFRGDLLVADGRIVALGDVGPTDADLVVDAGGAAVLPGLIQTHVHLCQTIFRGQADDLELLDWLERRVWPLEAAHDAESVAAAASLGCAELILGGTTTAVDMGTVHHTEEILRVLADSGLRAFAGKCMMDYGAAVPAGLRETREDSLRESLELFDRWDGAADGRIRYCFAPRFAVSCTEELLKDVGDAARQRDALIHTHASESQAECALIQAERGCRNVEYFHHLGMTGPRLLLAHCVHLNESEIDILSRTGTRVAHCPASNLKLGSGIARVAELRRRGVEVGIGTDGAACNNGLDTLLETRLAALLQSVSERPGALSAAAALELATIGGARVLQLDDELGSLQPGKRADVAVVDLSAVHHAPAAGDPENVISALVYAARAADVRLTMVDGRILMRDRELTTLDADDVRAEAELAIVALKQRAVRALG